MTDTQNESTWTKRQGELQRAIREHSLTARNAKAMLEYYLRLNCPEHQTTSHRDGHPKWCGRCGYTDQGVQLGAPDAEQSEPSTRTTFTVSEYIDLCHGIARDKGFWDKGVEAANIGEKLMLMTSEIAETFEEWRAGHGVTETYYNSDKPDKPEGVPIEIADLVIRVLDFCGAFGIDLEEAIMTKVRYNTTRPHMHGKLA